MNKSDIKNILMSMRTQDNEAQVNHLLGKLDMLSEEEISMQLQRIGTSEEAIKSCFNNQLRELESSHSRQQNERYLINKLFTYGISDKSVHLHLPGDLHELINTKGFSGAMDTVNLYLLDAIDKIKTMKNNQHPIVQNSNSIYMISPILFQRELRFLEELDFETALYSKNSLSDKDFVGEHPDAQLAIQIFGTAQNVGRALIDFETIASETWQKKKEDKIKEFNNKGIFIEETER